MRRHRPITGPGPRQGVTLPELLVIVAIIGILVALAVPGLHDFMLKQRLRAVHAQLVTDLQMARSEAVARNMVVNIRFIGAGSVGAVSCYTLFTDTGHNYQTMGPSLRCDCRQPPGSRCTNPATTEIRTSQIPRSQRVILSTPGASRLAFEPGSGNLVLSTSESGVVTGNPVTILSTIDSARSLAVVVGLSGRPTVCQPAGSTMGETAC